MNETKEVKVDLEACLTLLDHLDTDPCEIRGYWDVAGQTRQYCDSVSGELTMAE